MKDIIYNKQQMFSLLRGQLFGSLSETVALGGIPDIAAEKLLRCQAKIFADIEKNIILREYPKTSIDFSHTRVYNIRWMFFGK